MTTPSPLIATIHELTAQRDAYLLESRRLASLVDLQATMLRCSTGEAAQLLDGLTELIETLEVLTDSSVTRKGVLAELKRIADGDTGS